MSLISSIIKPPVQTRDSNGNMILRNGTVLAKQTASSTAPNAASNTPTPDKPVPTIQQLKPLQKPTIETLEKWKELALHRQKQIEVNEQRLIQSQQESKRYEELAAESPEGKEFVETMLPYIDLTINSLKEAIRKEKIRVPVYLASIEERLTFERNKLNGNLAKPSVETMSTVDVLELRQNPKSTFAKTDQEAS